METNFHTRLNECKVIYKMERDAKISSSRQRVTVAGYEENGTYRLGVSIRSHKDEMNKKDAKIHAARRAMFSPTKIYSVKRKTDRAKSKELHIHMRRLKSYYDVIADKEEYPRIARIMSKEKLETDINQNGMKSVGGLLIDSNQYTDDCLRSMDNLEDIPIFLGVDSGKVIGKGKIKYVEGKGVVMNAEIFDPEIIKTH